MAAEIVEAKFGSVPFSFALLHYRPNPNHDDFVSVGVVLHAPRLGFLGMRSGEVVQHLRNLFPSADPEQLRRELETLDEALLATGQERIATGDLGVLLAQALPTNSRLRWSAIETGVTNEARTKLNELCERLVDRDRPSVGIVP